jgi:hypothetical protein
MWPVIGNVIFMPAWPEETTGQFEVASGDMPLK